jgi:C4-dicarboxylate-specific signal transduction histidine kinase
MVRRLEQLEQDRTVTQESMIHAERLAALGEIAAGLAHEIHNPLDGMLECVRHLNKDPGKSSRADKYYPMLEDGLQRIAVTMRRMLTFAHSGQKVEPKPCLMGELLDALQLLVQARLDDSRVRLTWRRPKDRQCACDREGMSQAGLNLILNAVEAAETSPEPQVQIEGTCDAEWVYLTVGDSGPGVPGDLRDRIFKPFFTTRPAGEGTGLGLSVSRQLVRAGGGEVELASEPSSLGGAKFVIKLPRLPAPQGTP